MITTLIDREANEAWRRQVERVALELVVAKAIAIFVEPIVSGFAFVSEEPHPGAHPPANTLYPSLLRAIVAEGIVAAARGVVEPENIRAIAYATCNMDVPGHGVTVRFDDAAEHLIEAVDRKWLVESLLAAYADELATVNQQTATMVASHEGV